MSVKMRQEVERKIAEAALKSIIEAGYKVTVDYGDGESKQCTTLAEALAEMFQGDDDRVYVYDSSATSWFGWIYFVYGNDGYDVISDYTVNLESLLTEANKISDHYAD